jgi:RNA recognition motif-containing protein
MPLPTKPTRPTGRDSEESSTPSNNLWVGNLTPDVRDSDLMDLFAQYGALDSVTSYSARSYAFVFFKRIEDAKAAKNALQGFSFRGNSLKIEFARPVCSHLCALLIFNFSSDSCIVIIIYSNLIDFFFSTIRLS